MEIKKPKYPFVLEITHIVKNGSQTPIILWLIGFAIGGLTLKEILPYIMQLKK